MIVAMIVTIVFGICVAVYLYLTWNFDHWKKRGVPGPKPTALLGNLPSMVTQKKALAYEFDEIYRNYKSKANFIGVFNMRTPQLVAVNPATVKEILITKFSNFHDNELGMYVDEKVDPIFSKNPFLLKGEAWKEKRAEITPAFTVSRLKAVYPIIEDVCKTMTTFIKSEKGIAIDTRELTARYTTDVVSNCIFSFDAESFKNPNAKIREMGKELMEPSSWFMIYFVVLEVLPFIEYLYKIPFVPKHISDFFEKLMHDAVAHRTQSKIDRVDFLHFLLELRQKKNLSDLDLVGHAITFFLDGFETSSITMMYILYELAKNKPIQDKLRKEILQLETEKGLNYDSINDFEYLDFIFHESLRMHPPAVYISKVCTEPCKLSLNDSNEISILKDDVIGIPIYSIQNDPDHFPNPKVFNPDRFCDGSLKDYRDKMTLLPFGGGPRICLGMKFAAAQVKAGIVDIIKNFELSLDSKTIEPIVMDPKSFVNLPIGSIWIKYKDI